MSRRRTIFRWLPWVILVGVSASELAIGLFAARTLRVPLPAAAAQVQIGMALLAANYVATRVARRLRRARAIDWVHSTYQLASLGALAAGVLLGALLTLEALLVPSGHSTPGVSLAIAGTGSIAFGFGLILYGTLVGQHRTKVEEIPVHMPALAPGTSLRIAHITDLHIGPLLRGPKLRELVARVNETEPDLIAVTGDIFDFDPRYIEEGCGELSKLHAPLGVFAVVGNHDHYTGVEAVCAGIEQLTPIVLLRDHVARIELPGGQPLYVLGIDDPGRGLVDRGLASRALPELASKVPEGAPHLLLMHRPGYLPQVAQLGIPLALAGHTHGGQITLPWPGHHHNVARLMTPWTRGLYCSGATQMYVNRGLGVGGIPVRLNCPREIAILRIEPRP